MNINKHRASFFGIGIGCLILFYGFSRVVRTGVLTKIDFDTTVRLQNKIPARLDSPLEDFGFFASPVFSIGLTGLLTLIYLIDWKKKKIRFRALAIPLLLGIMTTLEIYGKSVVEHPAPPFFMLKNPTTIFPTYHIVEEYSYPSGHAARSLFIAFICVYVFRTMNTRLSLMSKNKRKIIILIIFTGLACYAGVIALSRIYLGHHWLSDIIGGWIVSIASSLLTIALL